MENTEIDILQKENAPCCRICSEPETLSSKLVSPCRCIGDFKYVHSTCMLEWIKKKQNQICTFCKYKIKLKQVHIKKYKYPPGLLVMAFAYVRYCLSKFTISIQRKFLGFLHKTISIVEIVLSFIFLPIYRVLSLSSSSLRTPSFINRRQMNNVRKQNAYTLLDTVTKLSMFNESNIAYREIYSWNKDSSKSVVNPNTDERMREVFNVIIFEDDLKSVEEQEGNFGDYLVFVLSLVLFCCFSYFVNPLNIREGDFLFRRILFPTCILLLCIYSVLFGLSYLINKLKKRSDLIDMFLIYCKLLIMLLLRYTVLPGVVGNLIWALCEIPVFRILLSTRYLLDRYFNIEIIRASETQKVSWILKIVQDNYSIAGGMSLVLLGNFCIELFEKSYRAFPTIVWPGLFPWICPLDFFISRIAKDSILRNIQSYFIFMLVFIGAILGIALSMLHLHTFINNGYVAHLTKTSMSWEEMLPWFYYYISVGQFLCGSSAVQSYFRSILSVFQRFSRFLSKLLDLDSLLFNGNLPCKKIRLQNLHYLPCTNYMPYNQTEVTVRRCLEVTEHERKMYFDENGRKKKIIIERFMGLEPEDDEWMMKMVGATREELLYNPAYSLFYIPPYPAFRVLLYIMPLFCLFYVLLVGTVLSVLWLFVTVENIRREGISSKPIDNIVQSTKSILLVVVTAVVLLSFTYNSRRFFVLRKIRESFKRLVILFTVPFIVMCFCTSVRELGYNYNTAFNQLTEKSVIWIISYLISIHCTIQNRFSKILFLLESALLLFVFKVLTILLSGPSLSQNLFVNGLLFFSLFPFLLIRAVDALKSLTIGLYHLPQRIKTKILEHNTKIVLACESS